MEGMFTKTQIRHRQTMSRTITTTTTIPITTTMEKKETRVVDSAFNAESRSITGHAAVFDTETELWPGTFERIDPAFFDDVMGNDVRALFNHDSNHVLGRTKSKTLVIGKDQKGLTYNIPDMPNTTSGNDLLELISRGDVSQSSFTFVTKSDKWEKRADGTQLRTLLKAEALYDVSPVTFPAYPTADVAKRSYEQFEKEQTDNLQSLRLRPELAIPDITACHLPSRKQVS